MSDPLYGTYQGVVVRDDDPTRQHRVMLRVPQILGSSVTGWCEPTSRSSVAPMVGDRVQVVFLGGDAQKPRWVVDAGVRRSASVTTDTFNGTVVVRADGLAHLYGNYISTAYAPTNSPITAAALPWWAIPTTDTRPSYTSSVRISSAGVGTATAGSSVDIFYEVA